MIDLHSHILPGLDDGAPDEEEMLAMARTAVEEGITKLMATPHHQNGSYNNPASVIRRQVKKANARLKEQRIPLEILPGQEVRIYGEMLEDLGEGDVLTLNGSNYLFVEFPSSQVPRYAKQLFYDLQLEGYKPVIVHPERNQVFVEKPRMLYDFVQNGALTQVTAGSVTGAFGRKIKHFSLEMIRANLTHIVASDAHNTTSRPFHLKEAYEVIEGEFDSKRAAFFQANAEKIIANDPVIPDQPKHMEEKSWLKRLLSK
ncbi:tyrosine-protein phosphatase [Alkalicoccus halolimnae]|uniref:Tyrosine-protein phosphatase n=1 Tax=Alkalicoccus halolimnae TaxID=1667239 RepID=A0A5C7FQN2_9BACI|nr:CpsB/CapC family capsule biosynthesis tyrosine phosphatase [Alkalicoccus halolimnae]TXF87005.1 tyrosine protein phosphatase [Alkalicoccus halolimnae]